MGIPHSRTQRDIQKILDWQSGIPESAVEHLVNASEIPGFCSDPSQYEWKYTGRQAFLVPFYQRPLSFSQQFANQKTPNPNEMCMEERDVLVVEGTLIRGESNVLARRRFYFDEESWLILLGEAYDRTGTLVKFYLLPRMTIPGAISQGQWFSVNDIHTAATATSRTTS